MFRINWTHKTIESNDDAELMRVNFKRTHAHAAAFDTEADGLSILRCKPFLFQFGWYEKETMQGWTYAIDLEAHPQLSRQVIKVWHALVKKAPWYLGHNVKFDLHMLTNLDLNLVYHGDNISDTMSWIRAGMDAVSERKGGTTLKLKPFATRYIDSSAKDFEHKLDAERTKIAKDLNLKLQKRLGWYKYQIDDFFKDKLHGAEDLPEDKRQAYYDWHTNDLPLYLQPVVTGAVDSDMISYRTLNRANVIEYGHYDIVWTLEAFDRLEEAVTIRNNLTAINIDNSNIYPVYEMERVGFEVDKEYLYECKKNVRDYILIRRKDLCTLAGRAITIGQHDAIKQVLAELGVHVTATGKDELDILLPQLKHIGNHETAVDFIEVLQELRTLEKWYSTYIMRFIIELKYGDKIATQINLAGAVSGRVTSDFQQFPKGAITTLNGRELFRPRRLFKVPTGYKAMVYLDYSQVELRLQAMYTILVGHPDLNLCRAYMPYQCHGFETTGRQYYFDYTNQEHLRHAYDWIWYRNENRTEWTPTDVHGATTKEAFGIDETDEHFHDLRYIGKRVNFAKQYGAQRKKIGEMFPEYDDATITRIDNAYYKAFPGVKEYQDYCYAIANRQPYAQNLFGRRYYNASGHELINMLIQGTGADVLKSKKPLVAAYLKEHGCKSKLQMEIHDEISILWHEDDDPQIFFDIKDIMEDFSEFLIPIVSEMEVTYATWADKKGVKTIEELRTA
jgi:DNA polymerase-1